MSSNTREYLAVAERAIQLALIMEREGTGASEDLIRQIDGAVDNLNRAILVQRAILTHRKMQSDGPNVP